MPLALNRIRQSGLNISVRPGFTLDSMCRPETTSETLVRPFVESGTLLGIQDGHRQEMGSPRYVACEGERRARKAFTNHSTDQRHLGRNLRNLQHCASRA